MTMCIWIPQYSTEIFVLCVLEGTSCILFVTTMDYIIQVYGNALQKYFSGFGRSGCMPEGTATLKSRVCSFTFLQLMCCLLSSCCGTAGRFLQSTQIPSYLNYACLFHCTKQINLIIFYTVCKCLHYSSMHACYIQSIIVIGFNFVLVNLHMRILM